MLEKATCRIGECYFESNITDKNSKIKKIFRERIYCYELYHQMRILWPQEEPLVLHGEYDKTGSQFFAGTSVKGVKPDFLIHKAGDTNNNVLAMEVKAVTAKLMDIKCDLEKLSLMQSEAGYTLTVFLLFGENAKEIAKNIQALRSEWRIDSNTEIWAHEKWNTAATPVL